MIFFFSDTCILELVCDSVMIVIEGKERRNNENNRRNRREDQSKTYKNEKKQVEKGENLSLTHTLQTLSLSKICHLLNSKDMRENNC